MTEEIYTDTKRRMEKAIESTSSELSKLRTGKASTALIDTIQVHYYGSMVPIKQVGNISVPEPRLIVIQPWDRGILPEIEKAILKSDLGLNPSNDGIVVRIPIPPLTEERRRDLVKLVKKLGEEGKVAIRNVRRDANDKLKNAEKKHEISEDDLHRFHDNIQELTNESIKKIDKIIEAKEAEIMEV
jgi:ribosome recycling factor